nr:EAL domain-containing protein [uncultured Rhodoferax sp.]
MKKVVGNLLDRLATWVFPAVLVALTGIALLWQLGRPEPSKGRLLPLRVWEETQPLGDATPMELRLRLAAMPESSAVETHLSVHRFWIMLDLPAQDVGRAWDIDFPSRHAMRLTCWDGQTGQLLGQGDRFAVSGALRASRAGFALHLPLSGSASSLVCQSAYRGPARISADLWESSALVAAQLAHKKTGVMLEAGIGVLAIFMLLTALVNRSALYWTFVGWLLLNMRMAGISAGTDFDLFGYAIQPSYLVLIRQWTVCMYYAMTIGLFSLLFKDELEEIKAGWVLALHQLSALLVIAACAFLSFERTLPILWVATLSVVVVMIFYLVKILRKTHSRVAGWYAASILVTLVASMNEVVAAAIGQRVLIAGLNSVTAAIASALLASAAVAEHMRFHRLQNQRAQKMLEAAYQDSPVGLFTIGMGQKIMKANPAFHAMVRHIVPEEPLQLVQLFGVDVVQKIVDLHEVRGNTSLELQAQVPLRNSKGVSWFAVKASTVDGSIIECSLQDITERVQMTERLEYLASHDPLTGCLNLRGLAQEAAKADYRPSALAYFDLDRFKLINDLYGHTAGDNVLKQVAERMASVLQGSDRLARVGGDEFVIVFSRNSMADSASSCNSIATLIGSAPFQIDNQSFALDVSGGLVGMEQFGQSPLKDIVSAADTLCRMAKKRSDQRLVVMESGDRFFQQHQDELDLINCLERGETPRGLFLLMQPEISLSRPFDSLNFEVLVRLRKPDGSVVPAGTIIEAAEAHGKTAIIDRWVVTTAIDWLERNAQSLQHTHFVGVNLSGGSLNDESFTNELFALFEQHPQALSKICIEITETVAITDMRNMQGFIDRVRSMGAKVGLDDFGAGYSSFGYLKGLSVDALKLDGSLVRDAARSQSGMAIIMAIGGLVNSLGMKSVGEFAEDLPTIRALVDAGIDYAQGYGISKPVEPEKILAASSGADFIQDPEILAFIKQLQANADDTLSLFQDSRRDDLH